jgi:hypothetical protein
MSLINAAKWLVTGRTGGRICPGDDDAVVEEINAMTNYELLDLIDSALEDIKGLLS